MGISAFPIKRGRPYTEDEFWLRVDRTSAEGCWPWLAGLTSAGRGQLMWRGQRRLAYRISWELEHGSPPPDDLFVCHACDNPLCVRPDHLFLGTCADNNRDMRVKGRDCAPPTHYGESHPQSAHGDREVRAVREAFAASDLTIADFAASLGLNPGTVRDWVRGKVRVEAGGPISTDTHGKNAGKPCREMRWIGATA